MRPELESVPLSPEQRFHHVARLLAAGVRRLSAGPAQAPSGTTPISENPADSSENFLEVSADPRLNVHSS